MTPPSTTLPPAPAFTPFLTDQGPAVLQHPAWAITIVVLPVIIFLAGAFLLVRHVRRLPGGHGSAPQAPRPGVMEALLVLGAALAFRAPGLGELGLHHMEPFYRQEIGLDAINSLGDLLFTGWAGLHMPLYRLVLAAWVTLTNDGTVLFARWISVCFGSLAALCVLRWAREAGMNRRMSTAAGLLVALCPVAIEFSRHTSLYAMATFMAAGLTRSLVHFLRQPNRRTVLFSLLWSVATVGTNVFCTWYALAAAAVVLGQRALSKDARLAYLGCVVTAIGMFSYVVLGGTRTMVGFGELQSLLKVFPTAGIQMLASWLMPFQLAGELCLGPLLPAWALTGAGMILVGLCVGAALNWWRGRAEVCGTGQRSSAAMAALTLLGLLAHLGWGSFWFYYKDYGFLYPIRYISVAAPALAVLVISLCNSKWARTRNRWASGVVILLLGWMMAQAVHGALVTSGRPDTAAPAQILRQRLQPRDLVAVAPPFFHSQMLLEHLVDRSRQEEPAPLRPDPGRTLATSLSLVRPGGRGVVALGASDGGISTMESTQGCFADRLWLLRYDERMPNGEPELNHALADRTIALFRRRYGAPLEHHAGHGFTLDRFTAQPWLLTAGSGQVEIPLTTHGYLVLLDGFPPTRWLVRPRRLDRRDVFCIPLGAGVRYWMTLKGRARHDAEPVTELVLTSIDSRVGAGTIKCPVEAQGREILARCPEMTARRGRPGLRVMVGTGKLEWSAMRLQWGEERGAH